MMVDFRESVSFELKNVSIQTYSFVNEKEINSFCLKFAAMNL
jgi:hypothetical protein